MAHSRRSFPGRSSLARKTAWSNGPHTGGAPGAPQTISASGTVLATIGQQPTVNGLTLVRTRGNLVLWLETAAAQGNGFTGAFGLLAVGNEAFVAGVGSVPDPQDDPNDERWFYHTWFHVSSNTATTADIGGDNMSSVRIEVDSKAMRKLPPDLVIAAVLGVVEIGTASLNFMFNSRTLVKLP